MSRRLAARKFQAQMICEILEKSTRPQLMPRWQEIAPKMSTGESGREINQEVRGKQPRKKEMPAAPNGEVLPARKRHPLREAARHDLAACVAGGAEDPARFECR